MSFSVWMSAFKDQDSFWFPIDELHRRFDHSPTKKEEVGSFRIVSEGQETGSTVVCRPQGDKISGFAIQRPSGDPMLWRVVAGFLRDLPCVLYWPSTTNRACMGSLDLLPHLPDDFIEACGIPFVSTDSEAIRKFVGENS
ncbi:MAG: hypothetical protein JNM30_00380 [Rhodospirillales bacterium]|nr:hypothetical protein [Rhodospirillales bacterium]